MLGKLALGGTLLGTVVGTWGYVAYASIQLNPEIDRTIGPIIEKSTANDLLALPGTTYQGNRGFFEIRAVKRDPQTGEVCVSVRKYADLKIGDHMAGGREVCRMPNAAAPSKGPTP
jgi:hypothetical protein